MINLLEKKKTLNVSSQPVTEKKKKFFLRK